VRVPYTLVSFHAHPDDEALLTGGTLARAAAEGHRVVLVVATAGGAGLTSSEVRDEALRAGISLADRRLAELAASARALGCARVECLGYADSGMADAPSGAPDSFTAADLAGAAGRLAAILTEEHADVLTTYDPAGGYGHPDHVRVHQVGQLAGQLAGTPVVLEATLDRRLLLRALRLVHRLPGVPADFDPARFAHAYADPALITHRVDVRRYLPRKRAAMAAHVSQASADTSRRTLAVLLRLPRLVQRLVLGREWYVQRGVTPTRPPLGDVFAGLAQRSRPGGR
jgi:LmbE family N-acetylglucosaminyl deacetylase